MRLVRSEKLRASFLAQSEQVSTLQRFTTERLQPQMPKERRLTPQKPKARRLVLLLLIQPSPFFTE